MSHPLLDPLPVGSVALTLKRADPRNAGLVVEILAHVGAVPEWRIEDGYRVRRIDGLPIPSSITYAPDLRIADANASDQLLPSRIGATSSRWSRTGSPRVACAFCTGPCRAEGPATEHTVWLTHEPGGI